MDENNTAVEIDPEEASDRNQPDGGRLDTTSLNLTSSRINCKYGQNCYRLNEDHKKEFSHPGDADYIENSGNAAGASDSRPECKYGTSCYRQNPQHQRDFKHTAAPKRKRKKVVDKTESDYESNDDYDFDDPFLNDGSSDDYQPTSSGSDTSSEDNEEDEEDGKRMLKEAKRFIKKKEL